MDEKLKLLSKNIYNQMSNIKAKLVVFKKSIEEKVADFQAKNPRKYDPYKIKLTIYNVNLRKSMSKAERIVFE